MTLCDVKCDEGKRNKSEEKLNCRMPLGVNTSGKNRKGGMNE